jgi:hypothetical protein
MWPNDIRTFQPRYKNKPAHIGTDNRQYISMIKDFIVPMKYNAALSGLK